MPAKKESSSKFISTEKRIEVGKRFHYPDTNIHLTHRWIQKLKTGFFTESALKYIITDGEDKQGKQEEKSKRNLSEMFRKLSRHQ